MPNLITDFYFFKIDVILFEIGPEYNTLKLKINIKKDTTVLFAKKKYSINEYIIKQIGYDGNINIDVCGGLLENMLKSFLIKNGLEINDVMLFDNNRCDISGKITINDIDKISSLIVRFFENSKIYKKKLTKKIYGE